MVSRKILKDLVAYPTVPGNTTVAHACLAYIETCLHTTPLYAQRYVIHDKPSLIFTTKRTKAPKLWLAAHIDVVPGTAAQYRVVEREGKLFGRGVYDMKFAVALYIQLIRELGKALGDYNLGIMLTSDEETGGFYGTQHLLEREGFSGDVAFLPDGGGAWQLEERAKGKWLYRITARGVPMHGSRPWLGVNANHALARFLVDLESEVSSTTRSGDKDTHWHLTAQATVVRGGDCENSTPAEAEALLDVRPIGMRDIQRFQAMLAKLAKKHTCSLTVLHAEPAYGIPKTNEYAKLFQQCVHRTQGHPCGWTRSHGSSDARFFARKHIPTLLVLPKGGGAHSDTEWVDIEDLNRYYATLRAFVEKVARVS